MNTLRWRSGVDDDIFDLAAYLQDQSEEVARRFVQAVEPTLKELAQHPGFGSPKQFEAPELEGVRSWPVEGFPNHLIYYLVVSDGIDVLAVLHGARDVEPVLRRRLR